MPIPTKFSEQTRVRLPAIYRSAVAEIRACLDIPKCKVYEGQAVGMETYAKKVRDGEIGKTAFRLRAWAIRQYGELLDKVPRAEGGHRIAGVTVPNSRAALAKSNGLSTRERVLSLRLAAIPIELFTELVEDEHLPTMEGLEKLGKNEIGHKKRKAKHKAIEEAHVEGEITGYFSVILADPPWRYEHPPIGSTSRSIENHYPTLDLDEICAIKVGTNERPVHDLSEEDGAVLFLWATAPKLGECFDVITAWGFTYRTCMVWVKDKIGMGYHVRNQHELLLIAKRGELAPPKPENRPSSVVRAERGNHSEKPSVFYDLIEKMYPELRKIELFSRAQRKGWVSWGLEAKALIEE